MNRILLHLFFLLLSSFFNINIVFSATPPTQIETSETITPELLQSKINALNERQGLDETKKIAALKQYQATQDNLISNTKTIEQIASFTLSIHQAPAQTKALQKEIEQTEQTTARFSKQKPEDFRQIPIEELEQRLILEKGKVSRLDEKLKQIETELVQQNNRPRLIREETVIAQQLIESTWKNLELPAAPSDSKLEHEARQLYFKTLIEARTTELKMLEVEAISQPVRLDLLKAQFQLFDIQKTALIPVVAMIEDLVFELRQQEAKKIEDSLSQTEKELENKHAVIQQYARENIKYSRDLQAVSMKIESVSDQKNQIENKKNQIANEFKGADKKIILASVSPTLGKILREQRRNLTSQDKIAIASHTLQNETALTSLEQLTVEDRKKQLLNLEATLKEIMRMQVDLALPPEQRMMIQAELRVLLNNQKDLLNKLASSDEAYLRALGDLDFSWQQMLTEATKFAAYLDERLLWVPSSEPINLEVFVGVYHSLQWLFSPTNWQLLVSETSTVFEQNGLLVFAAMGLLLLLVRLKQWAIQHSKLSETELRQWHTDHFYYTLRALLYLILLNLPIPIAAYLLGSLLTHSGDVDFNQAIGIGLQKTAISAFIWQFLYAFFSVDGVARVHFQWRKSTVILLHRHLAWLRFVVVPAMFLIQTTNASKVSEYSDALGRMTLLITLIAIIFFVTKQLHPSRELWQPWLKKHESHWLVAFPHACYALVIAVPLVIMGFAVMGYYLSALELQEKVISTLRLLMFTLIVHEIIFRWLTLVNRQLALQNAAQQREVHEKNTPILDDELPLDIPKINAQTRKLLHVTLTLAVILGFWLIWKNILPAFSFLDHIVLWQHKTIIENQESYQPITLNNLLLAGLYLFIAVVSVRNFSGVLELFIFRRWSIEAGSRYAINQLAKYFFITIAFIAIANELGGSWSQVQFLVAALGVGLGFGLQEIFANLVSGIILLFERPVRVGDTVTIGNVTGKVCRIQMRATTLIDADQLELIVPNKTFITSQLTNWTLSDSTTRIVIPIGIAFSSDVEFAHELMLQTVKETPLILDEPSPCVLFMGFGDSALNFSIRAFVSDPDKRLSIIHILNVRLERVLRENKIEIPYPQRDIHVKH